MKNHLFSTTICGAIALVGYISPAAALSPIDEVQRIAKQTTVQIAGCDRGSGVIIQKNGKSYTVLTVARAVKNSGCEIVAPDDVKYRVERVQAFPNQIDLALVTFTSNKNYPIAKLIDNSDRVAAAETVYITDFSRSTAPKSTVFTFVKGKVVANPPSKQQGKGYSLIYNHNTLSGHGGSPVWNDRSEVIAIHGGDVSSQLQTKINAVVKVKTGYQLGITVNTFTKFATAARISGYSPGVIAASRKPVDDLIASALLKERAGDYQGMLADMNEAIFLDSQNAQLYYNRGVAKSILGNKDAIEDYNQAIAFNPNEASVFNNRGVAKSDLGDKKGAIADYNRAISIDANYATAYFNRGNTKAKIDSPTAALDDLNRAIVLNPRLAQAYLSRGTVRAILGNTRGQFEDFNQAIALDPNYTQAYYNRGLARSTAGDHQGAIADFGRTIALNPQDPEPYDDRGKARSELGDHQSAIADFNRSIALNVNNAKAYANRGLVKAKLGDKKGAIVDLKKAANRFKIQKQTANYKRVIAEIERIRS